MPESRYSEDLAAVLDVSGRDTSVENADHLATVLDVVVVTILASAPREPLPISLALLAAHLLLKIHLASLLLLSPD